MGINRTLNKIQATDAGEILVVGYFVGAGAADPSSVKAAGVESVTRQAQGIYRITFAGVGTMDLRGFAAAAQTSAASRIWRVNAVNEANKTVDVSLEAASTGTDVDLGVGERVYFEAVLNFDSN